jgi:PAS domain S-box-containing protein
VTPPDDRTAALPAFAAGGDSPPRAGWFRFYFADERWEWSSEAAQIHGYKLGEVLPTTALIMSHKHPDDRTRMSDLLDQVRLTHQGISTRHRIIDAAGHTRDVVVVVQELVDHEGQVVGTHGFYIDVTPAEAKPYPVLRAHENAVSEAVAVIADNRSAIDQTKGMLMLIYGIDADRAFELLKWRSQETNIKLRLLAERLKHDFLSLTSDHSLPSRASCDRVFLTADRPLSDGDGLAS